MPYVNRDGAEPGIDQASLAARMGIDRNSASKLVAGLQAKGLLESRISALDRRSRSLWLTRRGEQLYLFELARPLFEAQGLGPRLRGSPGDFFSAALPPGNEPSFAKLLDLFMLVWPGGRERTESEHSSLLAAAGLKLPRSVTTASALSVLAAIREP